MFRPLLRSFEIHFQLQQIPEKTEPTCATKSTAKKTHTGNVLSKVSSNFYQILSDSITSRSCCYYIVFSFPQEGLSPKSSPRLRGDDSSQKIVVELPCRKPTRRRSRSASRVLALFMAF